MVRISCKRLGCRIGANLCDTKLHNIVHTKLSKACFLLIEICELNIIAWCIYKTLV